MHITLYKAGTAPIPPKGYGGAERFVYWLGKTLVSLGHRVTLIANAQSHIPGVELCPLPRDTDNPRALLKLVPASTDIVHLWDRGPDGLNKPYLLSVGGNGRPGEIFPANTIFVSRRHAELHHSRHFVYSAVIPEDYSCAEKREDYAVFLAKARWKVKNLDGAIAVARRAGLELKVIGSRNWPLNLQRLLPAVRGVRYYGSPDDKVKYNLLSRARCLIFPVRWEEPFGLAITEALASGCYVVGTPYGALPEIITPEVGVLNAKASVLADAVANPQRFSPQACRSHVINGGFSLLASAKSYIKYYERVLQYGSLGPNPEPQPKTADNFNAKKLLPWEN